MDTSSVSSSTGHSHLNGHRPIPPETLKAVVEASLKAVGQVKAIREAVRLLSRRHQEYEKYNDERWQAMNERISQLESARPNEVPRERVKLVNGHHRSQDDVSERFRESEDIVNVQDDDVPTLTTFTPVQAGFSASARQASSPSPSHVTISYPSHPQVSPSSAVSSRQAILSPIRQRLSDSQRLQSPTRAGQPSQPILDFQAGSSTSCQSLSPTSATDFQNKPFDVVPERLPTRRQITEDREDDVEGYEAFIEEMEGPGKGKGRAKDSPNGSSEGSTTGKKDAYDYLRDVEVVVDEQEEARLPSALRPLRSPGSSEKVLKGRDVGEQYKAIKIEHNRLKAWERQLEKQAARQEEIKVIHLDHEEELEKRLQAVIKREDKVQRAEAVLEMRSRGARPHEVEAAIYRRVEDARAIREECKRRAEELNEAEEAWCRAKKVDYVPVIKDGQWPFNIFPLDRCEMWSCPLSQRK